MKQIYKKIRDWLRDNIIGKRMRQQLKNKEFTIISSDCTGGTVYHDLHKRFDTPTINLYMSAGDFVKFCKNLREYIEKPLIEKIDKNMDCPVGTLEDITIFFVHYKTFEEAYEAWERRKARIRKERFYILTVKADGQNRNIERFDSLRLQNKLVFTIDKPYQGEITGSRYMCLNVPKGIHFMDRECGSLHYYYEQFPFLKWFNGRI